jgi:hypothetical protein
LQAVIILVQDGIELVVMAAGAAIGHADEGCAYGVGDFVEVFLAAKEEGLGVALIGEVAEEAGGDYGFGIVGPELVAGDLFMDELVVGLVGVERLDDVVAVAPGVGTGFVGLETVAVGVAGEIEPVASPPPAVVARG